MRLSLGRAAAFALLLLGFGAPAKAEWHEARSAHFIIYADQPADELRAYALKLERFDRAVRMVRRMVDPPLTDSGRVRIFVLPTEASVARLCDCRNIAGFYLTRASGSVAFVPRKAGLVRDEFELDADAVFFHEYAHHLQMQGADVALPPWAREGFAEFFARTQLRDDGTAVIGVPPAYRGYGLLENDSLGVRTMVVGADTYGEGVYSKGWALTHYLAFDPKRRGQFDRYIQGIAKGVPPLTAAEQAFGDLGELSAQLGSYIRRRKLPHLILQGVNVEPGTITIRALRPAEAEILPTYIRSERMKKAWARDVASDAVKIAASHPGDVFVQTVLAKAELDAKDYAGADAASTRALAADPNNFRALLYKGMAALELTRAGGQKDWHVARTWLLKANKADPEAAEPLILFYKSYLYAAEPPTRNAVDGLLYATVLTPQDSIVRMMAVRQLLLDGNAKKAKETIAPFAYSPHWENAWRAGAAKAISAIDEGRREEALAQVQRLQKLIEDSD